MSLFMKPLFVLALLAVAGSASAQDFCKQVKKEVSDNKVQTDFSVPFKNDNIPAVRVKRSISKDEDYPYDNFIAVFHAICPLDAIYDSQNGAEKREKSLTVIFEDGSKIVDDTVEISHDVTEDRTEGTRSVFYPLTPEQIGDISTKKISRFIIAGQDRAIPADSANAVMQYARCMKENK